MRIREMERIERERKRGLDQLRLKDGLTTYIYIYINIYIYREIERSRDRERERDRDSTKKMGFSMKYLGILVPATGFTLLLPLLGESIKAERSTWAK